MHSSAKRMTAEEVRPLSFMGEIGIGRDVARVLVQGYESRLLRANDRQ